MSKREPIDELQSVLRRGDSPATREGVVRSSLASVSGGGSRGSASRAESAGHSLPPSLPGVVNATNLTAPLGSSSSSSSSSGVLNQQLQQISTQLDQLRSSNQSVVDTTTQNT
ncbi:MAG: hypothetical protein ABI165_01775, partial [Bryobacteraceae bacterium]